MPQSINWIVLDKIKHRKYGMIMDILVNNIIFAVAIVAIIVVMVVSIIIAYKRVIKNATPVVCERPVNGDVHFDDICSSFIKLTNISDTTPLPSSQGDEE